MNSIDGFLIIFMMFIFAAVLALSHQRKNGYINHEPPEPTVRLQLEKCGHELEARGHQLATAQQSAEVWREVALKYKATIEELSQALENNE